MEENKCVISNEKSKRTKLMIDLESFLTCLVKIDLISYLLKRIIKGGDGRSDILEERLKCANQIDKIAYLKIVIAVSIFGLYSIFSNKADHVQNNLWWPAVIIVLLSNLGTLGYIPMAIIQYYDRKTPLSYARATVLGVMNYFELIFGFAFYYHVTNSLKYTSIEKANKAVESIDYLYYSFVTVSTIGLNNLEVFDVLGKILVMCQAFIFLIFVMIFMSYNIGRINQK